MEDIMRWLECQKIEYKIVDSEVVELPGLGKVFVADLSGVKSIFRKREDSLEFNLMENPDILLEEGIEYVAFPFGNNWYYWNLKEEFRFNILKYVGKRVVPRQDVPFVNLGVHTPYELLNGSGDLSVWVKKAKYLGHSALGICDYNTMAATLQLQKECRKAGIGHVFGYSFTLEDEDERVDMKIYCQSQQGLRNLLRIQKEIMVDSVNQTLSLETLLLYGEGNVLVLGVLSAYWIKENPFLLQQLEEAFEHVYYQVDLSEYKAERIDVEYLKALCFFFHNFYLPELGGNKFLVDPVLICDCYYPDKDESRNKILLNKIALGAAHGQSDDQYYKDVDEYFAEFNRLFDPKKWDIEGLFRDMCQRTVDIAQGATASYEIGQMYMPQYRMLPEEKERYGNRRRMFRSLLEEGLRRMISRNDWERYRKRLEEEVYIIESTNNVDYFLVQWDMVKEARKRGIAVGIGRGSAGGSLVSYLLGIISIDPIRYDLLFSRFLVPERCGLRWVEEVTVIGEDIEIEPGEVYVRVDTEHGCFHLNKWAKVSIYRGNETLTVCANNLLEGDSIRMDNRDLIWTLNEITL